MKSVKVISLLLLCFLLIRCHKKESPKKYKTMEKDNLIIKGYVINDTLFDDTVYYYTSKKILKYKQVYSRGKLDGISQEFYPNGNLKTQTSYTNGLKNGQNHYFDSAGKRTYSDFYYHGLSVGPILYYNAKQEPSLFFFVSLDNQTLMEIDYESWKGVNDHILKLINYTYTVQQSDSVRQGALFVYFVKPPKFSTEYSLYKRNRNNQDEYHFVADLDDDLPFAEYTLPMLSKDFYYSIRLSVYDSLLNKKTIINREVW